MMYHSIIKPLLFRIDPEKVHHLLMNSLKYYRYAIPVRACFRSYFSILSPFSFGNKLSFKNRIGLSAGFDKGAEAFDELADFGFGFIEIGTVTPHEQSGNPPKRIFRLVEDESLISRTGFNNPGVDVIAEQIKKHRKHSYILGANINKDPSSQGEQIINDFITVFNKLHTVVDYFTLNWGSIEKNDFENVLNALTRIRTEKKLKNSIFIKLPADIKEEVTEQVIALAERYSIEGFIATGPTMDRSALKHTQTTEQEKIGTGGVSGKGMGKKSLAVVHYLAKHAGSKFLIIGAGGIMNVRDAIEMVHAGADLVQIYSAFIFSGPGTVKKMGKGIK